MFLEIAPHRKEMEIIKHKYRPPSEYPKLELLPCATRPRGYIYSDPCHRHLAEIIPAQKYVVIFVYHNRQDNA